MDDSAKIIEAVNWFAGQMKKKLLKKRRDGFVGWDNPIWLRESGSLSMLQHASELHGGDLSQAVDVANLAMFLAYAYKEGKL